MTTVTLLPVSFGDVTALGADSTTSLALLSDPAISVSSIYGFSEADNGSNTSEASPGGGAEAVPWWLAYSVHAQVVFLCLLDLLCLCGNMLLVLTIYRCMELRNLSNFLILNLAFIGILLSLIVLPSWMLTSITELGIIGEPFCQAAAMIMLLLFLEAILTLGGVAIDRYGNICHPFRYPILMSNWKGCLFIACTWLVSGILSAVPFAGFGRYAFRVSELPLCTIDFGHSASFSTLILCLVVVPSFITIFFSYWQIFSVARNQARKVRNLASSVSQNLAIYENTETPGCSNNETGNGKAAVPPANKNPPPRPRNKLWQIAARSVKNSVRQTRAFRTVFTIIGCFLASWTPYIVLIIYAIHSQYKPGYSLEFSFTYLALANYVANPVICISMNKEFQKGVRKVFGMHRKRLLEDVVTAWMSTAIRMGQAQRRQENASVASGATSAVHPAAD